LLSKSLSPLLACIVSRFRLATTCAIVSGDGSGASPVDRNPVDGYQINTRVWLNYAPNQSQCRVRLPWMDLAGARWRFKDQMSGDIYDRDGDDLKSQGLFLDMSPWQAAVFLWTKES
jgi:hypothetical protein